MLLIDWLKHVTSDLTLVKFVRLFFLLFMVTATAVNVFYGDIINLPVIKAFTMAQIVGILFLGYVMGWTDGSGES